MKKKPSATFLCVDDAEGLASVCEAMGLGGLVKLVPETPPATWESAIDDLTNRLTSQRFDGLLLDFRLDEFPVGPNQQKVRYTAESLVNELRRKSVNGADCSYPIVLWSTDGNLKEYFSINPGYTGLYDGVWDKSVAQADMNLYSARLAALAKGYRELLVAAKKNKQIHEVLGCDATAILVEVDRAFTAKIKQAPFAFNYATFILNRVLKHNGVFVDQRTAAAMLGIADVGSVGAVIDKIADDKTAIRYSGVFSDLEIRFWRDALNSQLNKLVPSGRWLHLPAQERVAALKKATRMKKLEAARPIHPTYHTDYDCVCEKSGGPLARANGYRLHPSSMDTWIQPRYLAGVVYNQMPTTEKRRYPLDVGEQERLQADFER